MISDRNALSTGHEAGHTFHIDVEQLKKQASGRWEYIISAVTGIDSALLDGNHHPCPQCGGTDRFRMINKEKGTLYCNQCFNQKNGDGITAIQWLSGFDFQTAIKKTAEVLNLVPVPVPNTEAPLPLSFEQQVRFIPPDDHTLNKFQQWAATKPPIQAVAVEAANAQVLKWPCKAPTGSQYQCLAFPAFRDESNLPSGWILYRVNGEDFPEIPEGPKQRKTHLLRNSRDGWVILGGVQSVKKAHTIWKVEGIPDALALFPFLPEGNSVVTNTHGSKSAANCPLKIFENKTVIVVGDCDKPGQEGAERFVENVSELARKVVQLDLPYQVTEARGKDLRDYLNEYNSIELLLDQVASQEPIIKPDNGSPDHSPYILPFIDDYQQFPTECLPEPLNKFVTNGAKSIGCDEAYIALPLLSALGATIGTSICLELKKGWRVFPILWTVVLGESGSSKTPAFQMVMSSILKRERRAIEKNQESQALYESSLHEWEKATASWKKGKQNSDDPPKKPEAPVLRRYAVNDTTVEALAPLLVDNPRGLLLARDELSGWFGSLDKYSAGKGNADESHWLSMYNGVSFTIDRKTGTPRTLFVPSAAVSICGGIQPSIFQRVLGQRHRENGMAARFLIAAPPRKKKRWTEDEIAPEIESDLERLLDHLSNYEPEFMQNGSISPSILELSKEAKQAHIKFYNMNSDEQVNLDGELAAVWSKLEEIPARLAIILHCCKSIMKDPLLTSTGSVDAQSVNAAIQITEWFKVEAKRVYSTFTETKEEQENRKIIRWVSQKGGIVTVRDLQRGLKCVTTSTTAETILNEFVKAGWGQWVNGQVPPKGGHPVREFHLSKDLMPTLASKTS